MMSIRKHVARARADLDAVYARLDESAAALQPDIAPDETDRSAAAGDGAPLVTQLDAPVPPEGAARESPGTPAPGAAASSEGFGQAA